MVWFGTNGIFSGNICIPREIPECPVKQDSTQYTGNPSQQLSPTVEILCAQCVQCVQYSVQCAHCAHGRQALSVATGLLQLTSVQCVF